MRFLCRVSLTLFEGYREECRMYREKNRKSAIRPEKPLRNKRHELFCNIYAHEFWGRPAEAAEKAGYKPNRKTICSLFENRDIRARIRFLRECLADQSIADDAWIRENFIDIIKNADKTSDKIRALATLHRAVLSGKHSDERRNGGMESSESLLSLFEGAEDGEDY